MDMGVICVSVCPCEGQVRASDTLEPELLRVVNYPGKMLGTHSDPLEEKQMLLAAEPSL